MTWGPRVEPWWWEEAAGMGRRRERLIPLMAPGGAVFLLSLVQMKTILLVETAHTHEYRELTLLSVTHRITRYAQGDRERGNLHSLYEPANIYSTDKQWWKKTPNQSSHQDMGSLQIKGRGGQSEHSFGK